MVMRSFIAIEFLKNSTKLVRIRGKENGGV